MTCRDFSKGCCCRLLSSCYHCEVSPCVPQSQALLQQAQGALLQGGGESSTNPEPPSTLQAPAHQVCPFFTKTGACRFGNRCSRSHVYPSVSRTLLLPNMYVAPGALPGADSDAALEHDDMDRRQHFRDFFKDLSSEAGKHGGLLELRVCCNTVHHLRGNVYLRYERTSDAVAAAAALHGRYYAGRVVSCLFVPVENFRAAICGVYWRDLCPKGGGCNFLHPYPNPGSAYTGLPQHGASGRHRSEGSSRSSQRSSGSSSRKSRSRSPRSSRSYKRSESPASARTSNRTKSPNSDKYSSKRLASDRSHRPRKYSCSSRSSHIRSLRPRSKSPRPFKARKHSRSNENRRDRKRSSSSSPCSSKRTPTASFKKEESSPKSRRKPRDYQSPSREQSSPRPTTSTNKEFPASSSTDNLTHMSPAPSSTNKKIRMSPPPSSNSLACLPLISSPTNGDLYSP